MPGQQLPSLSHKMWNWSMYGIISESINTHSHNPNLHFLFQDELVSMQGENEDKKVEEMKQRKM